METCKSSGFRTATALIVDHPCLLTGVHVYGDTAADATLTLYDNQSAVGKVVFKGLASAETAYLSKDWVYPLEIKSGLYAVLAGANGQYCIEYIEG